MIFGSIVLLCLLPLVAPSSVERQLEELKAENIELRRMMTSMQKELRGSVHERVSTLETSVARVENKMAEQDGRINSLVEIGGNMNTMVSDTVFLAALSTDSPDSANPVIFDRGILNPSGSYNPASGIYTVPSSGVYQFHVQMQSYQNDLRMALAISVDGQGVHADTWFAAQYRSASLILDLQAGQTVYVERVFGAIGDPTFLRSYFYGYMLSEV